MKQEKHFGHDATTPPLQVWGQIDLGDLLALDCVTAGLFRNRCSEDNRNGRVFGGQLIAQALIAAQCSVPEERTPSSLQVIFMQGAATGSAVDYQVEPLQDGKRFSSRRVVALQDGVDVISAHASFASPFEAASHTARPRLHYPAPEQVTGMHELHTRLGFEGIDWMTYEKPCIELRIIAPEQHLTGCSPAPQMAFWVRLRGALDDTPQAHVAALAYLSDYWINSAAITHHIPARDAHAASYIASLNHTVWFHVPGRADGWLLFECDSPAMQHGRALSQARIYDHAGVLLASVAQECLFVPRQRQG